MLKCFSYNFVETDFYTTYKYKFGETYLRLIADHFLKGSPS